jgi:DNA polymerase I-like protein with 3'-5' exonuclease and polymerase domains
MDLIAMEPRGDLSSTGYALANPGEEYLVLQPDETADPFAVRLEANTYSIRWHSVVSRETKDAGTVEVEDGGNEATLYRRRFFQTYPGLKWWHEHERQAWLRGGTETRTLTGRRRMDVERLTDRLNAPVQGTAADGLKLALALLWERRGKCPGAVPVLVCHDEVIVECDAQWAADANAWLKKAMIEGMEAVMHGMDEVNVPVEVEARIARSWGESG